VNGSNGSDTKEETVAERGSVEATVPAEGTGPQAMARLSGSTKTKCKQSQSGLLTSIGLGLSIEKGSVEVPGPQPTTRLARVCRAPPQLDDYFCYNV